MELIANQSANQLFYADRVIFSVSDWTLFYWYTASGRGTDNTQLLLFYVIADFQLATKIIVVHVLVFEFNGGT